MYRVSLSFFFFGVLSMVGCTPPSITGNGALVDTVAEEAAIRALLLKQQEDWNEGSIEGFMDGYVRSDSLRFVGGSGEVLGWNSTLERYLRTYPDRTVMGMLTFDLRDIDILGHQHAMVFGSYSLERASDNPTGLFTLILVKTTNDGWRIIHDHTTADTE